MFSKKQFYPILEPFWGSRRSRPKTVFHAQKPSFTVYSRSFTVVSRSWVGISNPISLCFEYEYPKVLPPRRFLGHLFLKHVPLLGCSPKVQLPVFWWFVFRNGSWLGMPVGPNISDFQRHIETSCGYSDDSVFVATELWIRRSMCNHDDLSCPPKNWLVG